MLDKIVTLVVGPFLKIWGIKGGRNRKILNKLRIIIEKILKNFIFSLKSLENRFDSKVKNFEILSRSFPFKIYQTKTFLLKEPFFHRISISPLGGENERKIKSIDKTRQKINNVFRVGIFSFWIKPPSFFQKMENFGKIGFLHKNNYGPDNEREKKFKKKQILLISSLILELIQKGNLKFITNFLIGIRKSLLTEKDILRILILSLDLLSNMRKGSVSAIKFIFLFNLLFTEKIIHNQKIRKFSISLVFHSTLGFFRNKKINREAYLVFLVNLKKLSKTDLTGQINIDLEIIRRFKSILTSTKTTHRKVFLALIFFCLQSPFERELILDPILSSIAGTRFSFTGPSNCCMSLNYDFDFSKELQVY